MAENLSKAKRRDAVLRTMLRTPPDPHEPKPKKRYPHVRRAEKLLSEAQKAFGAEDPNWTPDGRLRSK